ncbi:helix-turn-helix transcriptional regulator [Clostridium perfringens]|uniref:helix-turn-helix transcriptional regulator n=1 Tax=Clostridium perfringens TaxID=1502 RepID=UPI001B83FF6E|nr:helix-turn-helix transcriptional regulator [Clostridium perfringens]HBC2032826.1 helix-turn-helix transcriptional regulator [Clostridium perfringens]HBC2055055.1 helix-turn-helix transcriptional regulator [Clostridium perfringens]HBC2069779.1 helix-turn-helix transcriptional regulator [Clostridium perfringens]
MMNNAIKKFIKSNNMGVVEFAKRAGVHKSVISTLINDKRNFGRMTVENACKISKAMNCSVDSIYDDEVRDSEI